MGDDIAVISGCNTTRHLGEEIQPFHHLLYRGVIWNILESFPEQLFRGCRHSVLG